MSNKRKTRAADLCNDCGWPTYWADRPHEYYMVTDAVWAEAGMSPDGDAWWDDYGHWHDENASGHLCIGCLEDRLGRELTRADFTDARINEIGATLQTERLRNRLARPGVVITGSHDFSETSQAVARKFCDFLGKSSMTRTPVLLCWQGNRLRAPP